LTVAVYDDKIATLAADDADLPIGRLTVSTARFQVLLRRQRRPTGLRSVTDVVS
jgi:hypothetical protein